MIEPTDPILNCAANIVSPEDVHSPEVQSIIDRMFELAAGKGKGKDSRQMVGLAAPQLGIGKRIIMLDLTADGSLKEQNLQALINPKITHRSETTLPGREGCWSTGSICGNVERAERVTVEALNREGTLVRLELQGFTARIAQHEIDHLEGIRFPDRIPANQPEKLHWVQVEKFNDYRTQWATWPILCPRNRWEEMKAGNA